MANFDFVSEIYAKDVEVQEELEKKTVQFARIYRYFVVAFVSILCIGANISVFLSDNLETWSTVFGVIIISTASVVSVAVLLSHLNMMVKSRRNRTEEARARYHNALKQEYFTRSQQNKSIVFHNISSSTSQVMFTLPTSQGNE